MKTETYNEAVLYKWGQSQTERLHRAEAISEAQFRHILYLQDKLANLQDRIAELEAERARFESAALDCVSQYQRVTG